MHGKRRSGPIAENILRDLSAASAKAKGGQSNE